MLNEITMRTTALASLLLASLATLVSAQVLVTEYDHRCFSEQVCGGLAMQGSCMVQGKECVRRSE